VDSWLDCGLFCVLLCLWVQLGCGGACGSLVGMGGFVPRSARRSKHLPFDDGQTTSCSPCAGHGVACMNGLFLVACSWMSWLDICARLIATILSSGRLQIVFINFFRSWSGVVWLIPVGRFEAAALHGWVTRFTRFTRFIMVSDALQCLFSSDSTGWSMSCGAKFVLLRGFFAIVMDIDGHRWTLLTGIISTNRAWFRRTRSFCSRELLRSLLDIVFVR